MHVQELLGSRELLWNLTLRELRGRYKRTVMGFGWSMLNPLASMLIFTFVFKYVLEIEPARGEPSGLHVFALWLLPALLAWNYFNTVAGTSMGSLIAGANLVKKVYFPRELLVYATTGSLLITHLLELALLAVALLAFGNMVLPWLPVMLFIVALLTVFSTGIGLILGALNVYFRDLTYLWAIAAQAWFYATPVVYPISLIHDRGSSTLDFIYGLNPMVRFVEAMRAVLYDLRMPSLATFGYLTVWSAVSFGVGSWVFAKLSNRFAEEL